MTTITKQRERERERERDREREGRERERERENTYNKIIYYYGSSDLFMYFPILSLF